MKTQILLLAIFTFSTAQSSSIHSANTPDRFFVVGHQKNDIETAKEAMNDGANALEIDLNFDENIGRPTIFKHGWPCDIDIVSQILGECSRSSPYIDLLEFLAQQPGLALIILEGKVKSLVSPLQRAAGRNTVKAIEEHVFDKGFQGTVVIGSLNEPDFVTSAAQQASLSKYKSQIYFTLLKDYSGAASVISFLQTLAIPNIIYSIGTITFIPKTYHDDIELAALNKAHGTVSDVFTWTMNEEKDFEAFYTSGARGITTNNVKNLSSWAKHRNLTLAQPGDDTLAPVWNTEVLTSNNDDPSRHRTEL